MPTRTARARTRRPTRTLVVELYVKDLSPEGYGIVRARVPVSAIDWTYADDPKPDEAVRLGDVYQLKLHLEENREEIQEYAWDLDKATTRLKVR